MPRGLNLYQDARYQRLLWSPLQLRAANGIQGGLGCLFEAEAGNFAFATGISQWRDLSGRGNHVAQATAANQPTFNQAGSYISFDGSNDGLENNGSITMGSLIPDLRAGNVFVVLRFIAGSVYFQCQDSASGASAQANRISMEGSQRVDWPNDTTGSLATWSGGTLSSTKFQVLSIRRTSAGKTVRINGTQVASDAITTLNSAITTNFTIGFGADPGARFPGQCDIKSLGIASTSDLYTEQRIEGYLAWKWGLVDDLVGNHPYKSRPPLIGA